MDLATIFGLVGAVGVVSTIILMGGEFGMFFSDHALIVVFGGAIAATLIRFPLHQIMHGFPTALKLAFTGRKVRTRELVDEISKLAELARREGPLALENVTPSDKFLAKGVRQIADGYDAELIRESLERERDLFLERLEEGEKIFRSVGDCAPAFGMVGTLIGMVEMFAHMQDPSKLGPFMATALLATLYGALMQNFVGIPIADKLKLKFAEEELSQTLIIDGLLQIRESKSPAIVREMLLAYLPEKHRAEMAEAA